MEEWNDRSIVVLWWRLSDFIFTEINDQKHLKLHIFILQKQNKTEQ